MTTFPELTAPGGTGPGTPEVVTTARVDWAPVPQVNLLPPEIVEQRRIAGLKKVLGAVLAVVLAGCAGAVVVAQTGVNSAQNELDAAQTRGSSLRAEQAKYAQVPAVVGLIDAAAVARQQAMANDVLWYGFLSDLSLTTPKGVSLENLQVSLDSPAGAATSSGAQAPDPLTPAGIGQVTFTGTANHFPDVASWLEAVGTVHGLDGSTLTTASRGDAASGSAGGGAHGGVPLTFASTIQVTSKALTHRYDRKAD